MKIEILFSSLYSNNEKTVGKKTMVSMNALKCKTEAPERKFYNLSVKTSMCGRLLHPGPRHELQRVPISVSLLLHQFLLPVPQASAAEREGTLTHGMNRLLKG